jgi:hypothetical protein
MSYGDYLPRPDREFLAWAINFLKYLMGRLEAFNFPQTVYQNLEQEKNVFAQDLEVAEEPTTHTKVTVQEKNDARKALETDLRQAIAEYLTHNHLLTDGDRQLLGLPVHKTTRTPVPVPTEKPDFTITPLGGSRLSVHYHAHDEEREAKNAKPFGVHGVEIAWAVLGAPPASYSDLAHSTFDTRSPYTFQFDLSDAGKRFYCCLRWENTTGQKGPWSEIMSAIIP